MSQPRLVEATKMLLVWGLLIASAIAFLWTTYRSQKIFYALLDSFPLQFRDELTSRYAFHYVALARSTPLHLQRAYVGTLIVFCLVPLGVSLSCLLLEKVIISGILFAMFIGLALTAGMSWRTYRSNCNRQESGDSGAP